LHFTYDVARDAVRFYVDHVHQLIDIHPRRLQPVAQAMTLPPVLRDGKLRQMLRNTDQRPSCALRHRRSTGPASRRRRNGRRSPQIDRPQ
jgi:hypothetical protein